MVLDDHGLTLYVVGEIHWQWSSRGHHKCKQPVNLISLHVYG